MKYIIFALLSLFFFSGCLDADDGLEVESVKSGSDVFGHNLTGLQQDDYVLTPAKSSIDFMKNKGLDSALFVFYPRLVIGLTSDSVIVDEIGTRVSIPNLLVIPFSKNCKVIKGDVLLTWWQKGTGMQRAIVLNSDSTYTPTVYYLDNQYSLYSPATDIKYWMDTLLPNSFLVLRDSVMVGRSALYEDLYYSTFYKIVSSNLDKVVAINWAGSVKVFDKYELELVSFMRSFDKGDSVMVPYYGTYCSGRVKKVWADLGKLTVDITFIDEKIEVFANVVDAIYVSE